ncbi:unnamed protein product [Didymodactylos carnosus]|uniref:Uncharacterized protein n=1 Tax=Didymodactylos carnosus TaxID=1234261 RepID=A0A814NP99_9BILA|nr:unnamed protein product [Didymodactylos carnosus]CAF1400045.1 unnamed protein product [Didymodactylos carnosus]CAF3860114.1 unnamed protein product [Didymodactylos carnosus]CAF4207449.1 unnamed protein product [Didymodactylos carnosus]
MNVDSNCNDETSDKPFPALEIHRRLHGLGNIDDSRIHFQYTLYPLLNDCLDMETETDSRNHNELGQQMNERNITLIALEKILPNICTSNGLPMCRSSALEVSASNWLGVEDSQVLSSSEPMTA